MNRTSHCPRLQVLVYAGALPAAMLGVLLANARRGRVLLANPSDLSSPNEVDMWVRYTLADALDRVLHGRFGGEAAASDPPVEHPAIVSAAATGVGCPVAHASSSDVSHSGTSRDRLTPQMYASMDVDERTATVPQYLPPALVQLAEVVLQVRRAGGIEVNTLNLLTMAASTHLAGRRPPLPALAASADLYGTVLSRKLARVDGIPDRFMSCYMSNGRLSGACRPPHQRDGTSCSGTAPWGAAGCRV